jgi:hypothetical protein
MGAAITLDDEMRAHLARLADILIPPAPDQLSASEAGVHERWLDRVLGTRPDLREVLMRALAIARDMHAPVAIRLLGEQHSEEFEALGLVVSAAYFMNPRVRKRISYRGQRPRPILPDEAEYYLRGELLRPVIDRGAARSQRPAVGGSNDQVGPVDESETTGGADDERH